MTLTVAARVELQNTGKVRTELRALGAETKAVATQTRDAGAGARQTAADFAAYDAKIAALEAQLRGLTTAMAGYEAAARRQTTTNTAAAGSVGIMAAQFNDVAVTLAAGQNPFQVAIQQGTQIGQAFGGQGAAGALNLVKQGFLAMISPVNLATIALIAGGGALVQWAISAIGASEKTASFAERVDALKASTAELDRVSQIYSAQGLQQIIEKYGEVDAAILAMIERQNKFAQNRALEDARSAVEALRAAYIGYLDELDESSRSGVRERNRVQSELGLTVKQALALRQALNDAGSAQTFDAQAEALGRVNALLAESKVGASEIVGAAQAAEDSMRQLAASAPRASWMNAAISGIDSLAESIDAAIRKIFRLKPPEPFKPGIYDGGPDRVRNPGIRIDGAPLTPRVSGAGRAEVEDAGRSGAGAASGVRDERDAIKDLIAQQRLELDLLRETDPVKRELLRQREALASATDAERRQIETLIRARQQEAAAAEAVSELTGFLNQSAASFLDGLIVKGAKASDIMRNLFKTILQAGIQAFALGRGPLAGLLGLSGGLFGGILGGIAPVPSAGFAPLPAVYAQGGRVSGPGTGTSDSIPAWLSDGEHVINARAASRHRGLLEMINAGVDLPAFASGGAVGPARPGQRSPGERHAVGGAMAVRVDVSGARGNAEIEEAVTRGVEAGIRLYRREALALDVRTVLRQDGRVTG